MSFNIKQTRFEIGFGFWGLLLLFIVAQKSEVYLITLISASLHETIHLIFIYKLSTPPISVKLSVFGGEIKRPPDCQTSFFREILINLSAPVFNIIVGFLTKEITVHSKYDLSVLSQINFVLGVFNLLPYYNFDGGNAAKNLLKLKFSETIAEKTVFCLSLILTAIFAFFTVDVFLNNEQNFSLLAVCVYMIFSLIFKN